MRIQVRNSRRLALGATASLLLATLLVPAGVQAATMYHALSMSGDAVVPGPGDPDGSAEVDIVFDIAGGTACLGIEATSLDTITAVSIGQAAPGDAGTIVFDLPLPVSSDYKDGCATGFDSAQLAAIDAHVDQYFLQIATEAYPDGAIRGQMTSQGLTDELAVVTYACPPGLSSPESLAAAGGPPIDATARVAWFHSLGCVSVVGPEELFPPLAEGYTWASTPLFFDPSITVQQDGNTPRTESSAMEIPERSCDHVALKCVGEMIFDWGIVQGDLVVRQRTVPPGYAFAFAQVTRNGHAFPYVDDASSRSVAFRFGPLDGSGLEVLIVDIDAPAPTNPSITVPPTALVGRTEGGGVDLGGWLLALLATGLASLGAAAVARRSAGTRP
jgi:hypothetical protein